MRRRMRWTTSSSPQPQRHFWTTPPARPRERHTALRHFSSYFVVLFAGKLSRGKRAIDVVRAVARLGPDAVLLIAGAGEQEPTHSHWESQRLDVRTTWLGFVNQNDMGRVYACADCLVLPSQIDSWGLVVNEAMATGLPAIVGDRVGCAPDLVSPGETGEVFPTGGIDELTRALERVRQRGGRAHMAAMCRERVARYSFERTSIGLTAGCHAVARAKRAASVRVVACCGGMVIVSGLERMTFEVLRLAREHGGAVHCIVNSWENPPNPFHSPRKWAPRGPPAC